MKAKQKKIFLNRVGFICISIGLVILFLTFFPIVFQEARYEIKKSNPPTTMTPVDTDFGIIIPKIGANAKVIARVNPYDSRQYQYALSKGVAHAGGSSLPGNAGNIFLFSHSSLNFYDALRFNSVFYLLDKLESADQIEIYYKNMKYSYHVTGKKIVSAQDISYLTAPERYKEMLTLMTCWPPGTSYKRLIVTANRD